MKQKYRMRNLGWGEVMSLGTHLRGRIARLDLDHLLILLLLLLLKLLLLRLLRSRRNLWVHLRWQAVGSWSVAGGSVVGSRLTHLLRLLLLLLGLWCRWGAEGIPFWVSKGSAWDGDESMSDMSDETRTQR